MVAASSSLFETNHALAPHTTLLVTTEVALSANDPAGPSWSTSASGFVIFSGDYAEQGVTIVESYANDATIGHLSAFISITGDSMATDNMSVGAGAQVTVPAVPESGSIALFMAGLTGLAAARRRGRR